MRLLNVDTSTVPPSVQLLRALTITALLACSTVSAQTEVSDTSADVVAPTPYADPAGRFTAEIPAGWDVVPASGSQWVVVRQAEPERGAVHFAIIAGSPVGEDTTTARGFVAELDTDEGIEAFLAGMRDRAPAGAEPVYVSHGVTEIGVQYASRITTRATIRVGDVPAVLTLTQYTAETASGMYRITISCGGTDGEDDMHTCAALVRSFAFGPSVP